ncbi:hypothetical protein VSS74_00975 [Conexibacter stalactiti]|uniref:Uncharacterized protein n=1 Tax=Conexibacter stalactiti TaxID=1940611 RepID=A0ABU4HI17_9ACTN|nr:hypothetical protein [Conexibacter stalactiti]MDW5592890.1 hypothetical protein [Conexibacter stalactiti]MEC5033531.1 hypothetical protein [Conexibacter stalactiti]
MSFTTATVQRLLALLACAAIVAAFVALTGGGTAHSEDAPTAAPQPAHSYDPQPPAAVVAELEAEFEEQFALLREPGGDAIPATTHIDDPRLDVAESRQLTPPPAARLAGEGDVEAPEAIVFVTPKADGSQCLLAVFPELHGPGQTCAFADQAADGYFLLTYSPDNVITELYGLMPDGVDEVTVDLADGSSVTLPVISNGYLARFDQPTVAVNWTDADGVEQSLGAGSGD